MVYVIGHTQKEYFINGILIPKSAYNEEELVKGRKTVLPLSDEEWGKIKDHDMVKFLLSSGHIEVLDQAPADKFSTNADLQEALTRSEEARVRLQKEFDALKAESIATVQELQAKLAERES